jgi:hypothetical protein
MNSSCVYTKSSILEVFNQVRFKQDLFTTEALNDSPLILEVESSAEPVLLKKNDLDMQSAFVVEEVNNLAATKKKPIPCWRKLSDPIDMKRRDRLSESNEIHFSIQNGASVILPTRKGKTNGLSVCHTEALNFTPQSNNISRSQAFKLLINIQDNGQDNNSHDFKINNFRHIKDNNKIEWYLFNQTYNFEFGPFKTDEIIEFYNNKLINQETKIRLCPEFYDYISDQLKKSPIEYFVIKDVCNVFCIKEKCNNKTPKAGTNIKFTEEDENYNKAVYKKKSWDYKDYHGDVNWKFENRKK